MSAPTSSRQPQHCAKRQRALARTLHRRLFVTAEGRVLVAAGRPDLGKLRECLARHATAASVEPPPLPWQLGLPSCDGELTEYALHTAGSALCRWRHEMEAESHHRPASRRNVASIAAERQEIDRLAARLALCHAWRRQLAAGQQPAGSPYLLDDTALREFEDLLARHESPHPYPSGIAWLARVVYWLSGGAALSRFLGALVPLWPALDEAGHCEHLRQLKQRLYVWKRRSEYEPHWVHGELAACLQKLPDRLVREGGLTARRRQRSLSEHCDLLISRCQALLNRDRDLAWSRLPAALAALAAADGGQSPLPARIIGSLLENPSQNRLDLVITKLAAEAGQPGYDALLVALDRAEELPCEYEYGLIRDLLLLGASLDDVSWACRRGLVSDLARATISPARIRRIATQLDEPGGLLKPADTERIVPSLRTARELALVERWIQWTTRFTRRWLTPRLRNVLRTATLDLLLPSLRQADYGACWSRWFEAAGCEGGPALRRWLNRIARYQQLAGDEPSVPKSVRKLLGREARDHGQREYLRARILAGDAGDRLRARFEALSGRMSGARPASETRLARAAEESCMRTAIGALRVLIERAARAIWEEHTAAPVPDVPLRQLIEMAQWLRSMTDEDRHLVRATTDAWLSHAAGYKAQLPQNQAWLAAAAAWGLNASAWLRPARWLTKVNDLPVEVGVAEDPRDAFLMGEFFNTCLSPGQCNEMSVLANAYDANKQVVLMVASCHGKRRVIARQLIAVSSDFRLLGYHCYVGFDKHHPDERLQCLTAMAAYCGRLARRCGLTLANDGEPAAIGNHFWYDDGVWNWHPAAHQAWAAEDQLLRDDTSWSYTELVGLPPVTMFPAAKSIVVNA